MNRRPVRRPVRKAGCHGTVALRGKRVLNIPNFMVRTFRRLLHSSDRQVHLWSLQLAPSDDSIEMRCSRAYARPSLLRALTGLPMPFRRTRDTHALLRRFGVSILFVVLLLPCELVAQAGADVAVRVRSADVIGDLRLHALTSKVFGNTRTLRVLVPNGYDAPENRNRRYAVLYLADGQNLFDPASSVFGRTEWRVDEIVKQLVDARQIPPMIVVGVDNAGRVARGHEYLPYPDTLVRSNPAFDPAPEGKRYPDFMIKEVMPYINQRYRTMTDAAHTGIGGSSYGALISTYVVTARPGVFGRLDRKSVV